MAIMLMTFGILFGASAAGFILLTGGSVLMAIVAYSAAGTLGALVMVGITAGIQAMRAKTEVLAENEPNPEIVSV